MAIGSNYWHTVRCERGVEKRFINNGYLLTREATEKDRHVRQWTVDQCPLLEGSDRTLTKGLQEIMY